MKLGRNLSSDVRFIVQALLNPGKKKCFYLGWTGYANLGDEALKEAIFDLLSSRLVFAESRGAIVRFFEKLHLIRFDVLMLGGGTLVLRSKKLLDAMRHSPIRPRIIFGTGVANHEFWKDVPDDYGAFADWKKLLEEVDYLGVRGPVSQQLLKNIGLKRDVPVMGDPVLYFTRPLNGIKTKRKRLGVNIGTAHHPQFGDLLWGRNEQAFVERFSQFLKAMLQDGWDIEFVPVYPKDLKVIDAAIQLSGGQGRIKIFQDYNSVQKTIERMQDYDIFVGQKLHSVVLSYCANTPAVMIEYRPKCRDFMTSIGMEKFNIRTSDFSVEKITPLFTELYANLETYRSKANSACLEYKARIEHSAKDVLRILG